MSGYSLDLRERIVAARQEGKTQAWIAATFQVSVSTVKRYLGRLAQTGSVAATVQRRTEAKISGPYLAQLRSQVDEMGRATLAQHCVAWEQRTGMRISEATMCRALARQRLTLKK
jgi:transposase